MIVEPLDDLPVLGDMIKKLDVLPLYERHFPDHGHWQGISGGQVLFGWLLYILSEGDHRLSHVEGWAAGHLNCLSAIMGEPSIRQLDFSDDRLGRLLDRLAKDKAWEAFEQSLGQRTIQVYLPEEAPKEGGSCHVLRADSFNIPQFRKPGELFQFGYAKQRRSDAPFCKAMVGYIDSLSVPLTVDLAKGSGPDYEYYLPAIKRMQGIVGGAGNLYVGDSHMGSLPNRWAIHEQGNFYLCPLNHKQISKEMLDGYLGMLPCAAQALPGLFTGPDDKRSAAHFFELAEQVAGPEDGTAWEERRILIYSPSYAQGLQKSFSSRLDEAEEKIKTLVIGKRGRRNPATLQALHARIGHIVEKYQVEGCFDIQCGETVQTVHVQKHKDRPARTVEKIVLSLSLARKEEAIAELSGQLGWQVYGSNAGKGLFPTAQLVAHYREQYAIEHLFDYFINRDVGLLPVYLKKEGRVKGLVRLLSIAMKCSMLVQYQMRSALQEKGETLNGIYPGNKGRKTSKPTSPMLLRAFKGIAVVRLPSGGGFSFQMVALNDTQNRILELMQAPSVYARVLELLNSG